MNELNFGPIDQRLSADVIVVGGGPAGMCAAIAAAREGVRVILVEQGAFCGGMATRGLVGPFMTCYDAKGDIQPLLMHLVDNKVDGAITTAYYC